MSEQSAATTGWKITLVKVVGHLVILAVLLGMGYTVFACIRYALSFIK